ncbi:MAG: PD-(D/E)XK nuclease family protein [Proteobacteria bacterium]|nr:PD-(D/E)XK nuclease family protein [Pseudomonadota bacterium]
MTESNESMNDLKHRSLAEFLVGNSELEELSAKLSEFNILQVLRIEQAEIRHSNVLAWLLNPRESHGLLDTFVRRFISTLLLDNEQADFGLSPAKVELMNFSDVEVRREWSNIDLLIYSKENRLILLIEKKIRTKESKGQLVKYKERVRKTFPDVDVIIPVILTLDGDEPSTAAKESYYIPWSYVALYKAAGKVAEQNRSRIPEDAQTFLRHYLNILRRETMQDKELEDLCKSIYRKHKGAIDLIVQYGATTGFGEAADGFITKNHSKFKQTYSAPGELWFVPKEWARAMHEYEPVVGWRSPYPVSLWFVRYQQAQKVSIILEVGPMTDGTFRQQLVKAFAKAGFRTTEKSYREDARYTRVYSRSHKVRDLGDSDEIKEVIEELWQQSKDKVAEATKVINNFGWKRK